MRVLLAFGLTCISLFGFARAQDGGAPKLGHKPAASQAVSSEPVTQSEARATFKRVIEHLKPLAKHKLVFASDPIPDTGAPVTREQVLAEFDCLYRGLEHYMKFTPRELWYDKTLVTVKAGRAAIILDLMIHQGFVARVGVLATSPSDTMSVKDFGDAVGIFVARAADLTHLPVPEYTPYLEAP